MSSRWLTDKAWRFVIALFLCSVNLCNAQVVQLNNVPEAFEKINVQRPELYYLDNKYKVPKGGHLQGIQGWFAPKTDSSFSPFYPRLESDLVITGSSNTYSYYVTAQWGPVEFETNKPKKIQAKPYRHAGGCQLIDKKLFVGIEDNAAKNKSRIMMISLPDTGRESEKVIIERQGSYKRSTAGAVGVTQIHNDHYLVAVGDWDSRNVDFYISRLYSGKAFDSLTTFHAPDNAKWCSYQSINLLSDKTGNLFLIGFCLDGNKNRADLFKVDLGKEGAIFTLLKTSYFKCPKGTSFRYGAGVRILDKEQLEIYACQRKLKKRNFVSIFRYLPKLIEI